ncbi:hypothetical protein [uncultured Roseobacter sp.]|uniref:hypothetical protein n=1 Tax=uncultured Roseobacter sp. TaxID=114847 RepID=UPI0026325BF6|nr:hypothetical protein [uncultured Roseobacter sp.]
MMWNDWDNKTKIPAWPAPYLDWANITFKEKYHEYVPVYDPVSLFQMRGLNNYKDRAISRFPVDADICNKEFEQNHEQASSNSRLLTEALDDDALPKIDQDTILAAIIDVDIGFGHRRFRDENGGSRVLASWQQSDKWVDRLHDRDKLLPFGRTRFKDEIDGCLCDNSQNGLKSQLDEWAFNHQMGLADLRRQSANKGLLKGFAHGTHVLGLFGGVDPALATDKKFARRVKFLVVNLPPNAVYGEGGAFLDYFLGYGLHWVTEMYGRLMKQIAPAKPTPLVANISFGKQAGPKDEQQAFVRSLVEINAALKTNLEDEVPSASRAMEMLNIFMPAGNDNLSRGHASCTLNPGEDRGLDWVILPDDQSSNFVEIWAETKDPDTSRRLKSSPLLVEVVPPGDTPSDFCPVPPTVATRDLGEAVGRIYAHTIEVGSRNTGAQERNNPKPWFRYRFLICLRSPNFSELGSPDKVGAPAGRWKICIKNRLENDDLKVRMHIQTDAAPGPGQKVVRGSYFDDRDYIRTEYSGRVADTYTYVPGRNDRVDLDRTSYVRRHGTLNSYAANKYVITVGGFRLSDGRPANYSGTGFGIWHKGRAVGAPQVLLPSEHGYAHFGILTDGATDGSARAVRGTSFASACAARFVLESWIKSNPSPLDRQFSIRDILERRTQSDEGESYFRYRRVDQEKAGAGRMRFLPKRGVERFPME